MKYDPQDLYRNSSIPDIQEWLEACEDQMDELSEKDQEFVDSVRQQFDAQVKRDYERPLTGKQLVVLRSIYDKLEE